MILKNLGSLREEYFLVQQESLFCQARMQRMHTHCTAAVLRGKDSVMKTAATVKENCGDIYEDAKDINEVRYEKAAEEKVAAARAIVEEYEQKAEEEA